MTFEGVQAIFLILLYLAVFRPEMFEGFCIILYGAFMLVALIVVTSYKVMRPLSIISWKGGKIAGRASGRAGLLLWFVMLEAFKTPPPETDQDYDPEPEPGPRPARPRPDKLAGALTTLGLTRDNLTPQTLKQAYRQAIRAAHPDLTGNTEDAIKINRARDVIRAHFNWN